jgi:hypothetical protein
VIEEEEETGSFNTEIQTEVGATVTHPPGTTFDDEGKPIPPKDDDE